MKKLTIVLLATITLTSCMSSRNGCAAYASAEVINTAEDIIEWIIEDEASGNVGREQADTYIDNLEQMIKELE